MGRTSVTSGLWWPSMRWCETVMSCEATLEQPDAARHLQPKIGDAINWLYSEVLRTADRFIKSRGKSYLYKSAHQSPKTIQIKENSRFCIKKTRQNGKKSKVSFTNRMVLHDCCYKSKKLVGFVFLICSWFTMTILTMNYARYMCRMHDLRWIAGHEIRWGLTCIGKYSKLVA